MIGEGWSISFLPSPTKEELPATPWDQIEKMRHVLVHGYYQILPEVLWLTINDDLPPLQAQILAYLSELE